MRVTIADLRTIPGFSPRRGFCARGGRDWFAAHGLDWADFVREGIDEVELLAADDALGAALVEWAHTRADHFRDARKMVEAR